jgi:hypothetical protein
MRTSMQVNRRDERIVPASGRNGISFRSGVWTRHCGAVIELARLGGPRTGLVRPPAYLFPDEPEPPTIDLADCAAKARLYTACLIHGGPYDAYRYINVFDLAILLPTLKLPHPLAASWARAFRDAGLVRPTDLRQERHVGAV